MIGTLVLVTLGVGSWTLAVINEILPKRGTSTQTDSLLKVQ